METVAIQMVLVHKVTKMTTKLILLIILLTVLIIPTALVLKHFGDSRHRAEIQANIQSCHDRGGVPMFHYDAAGNIDGSGCLML